jgi:RNA polymerase sigma-70 factor, ECF subfamily
MNGATRSDAETVLMSALGRQHDAALARLIAAGDRTAFVQMMRHHNRRLYRLARAVLRDDAEAEDALQEAYLAAYKAIGGYRAQASLATWLSRLVLNECMGRQRRQARRNNVAPMFSMTDSDGTEHDMADTEGADAPDEALQRSEIRALLERKLDALPQAYRVVFVLRCVEELSVEETAQYLDIPEATVRSRHFRARSMLRESLARALDLAEGEVFSFGGARCDRIVEAVLAKIDR